MDTPRFGVWTGHFVRDRSLVMRITLGAWAKRTGFLRVEERFPSAPRPLR
jgi:hypothetical protein